MTDFLSNVSGAAELIELALTVGVVVGLAVIGLAVTGYELATALARRVR